jgi:hypothetical protein
LIPVVPEAKIKKAVARVLGETKCFNVGYLLVFGIELNLVLKY